MRPQALRAASRARRELGVFRRFLRTLALGAPLWRTLLSSLVSPCSPTPSDVFCGMLDGDSMNRSLLQAMMLIMGVFCVGGVCASAARLRFAPFLLGLGECFIG